MVDWWSGCGCGGGGRKACKTQRHEYGNRAHVGTNMSADTTHIHMSRTWSICWDKSPTKIQRFTLMCPIHGNL